MAVVSSDFLAAMLTGYRIIFETEFPAAEEATDYKKIATITNSQTDRETYRWLGTVPQMQSWSDERVLRGLLGHDFTIVNDHYEATIQVDRDAYEDDKYSQVSIRVKQLAQEAARYNDQVVFTLLNAGHTALAFDGTAFFAAARTIGASANINNIVAGAYSATAAVIRTGIGLAVLAMRRFEDDRGRPMNLVPDTIVCAPEKEILIREALQPGIAGVVRPETAWVKDIIVSPYLTEGATAGHDWYMLCTKRVMKPIIYQLRKNPEFVSMQKPDDYPVFMRRAFLYGVDDRFGVGFGDPRYAVKLDCSD